MNRRRRNSAPDNEISSLLKLNINSLYHESQEKEDEEGGREGKKAKESLQAGGIK